MAVEYDYHRGVDTPTWEWLAPHPQGVSYHGCSNVYDGARYIYWIMQSGTTATTASTTQLWRYCTWTDSWHYLAAVTSGNRGMDVEHDPKRNVLFIIHGAALTSWQVFNLNTTNVTIGATVCAPYTLVTMTPVLPAAAEYGASLTFPSEVDVQGPMWEGTTAAGSTATVVADSDTTAKSAFQAGMIGLTVRITSGPMTGETRTIASVQSVNSLTVSPAFPSAIGAGVSYSIELTTGVATSATTNTLVDTTEAWVVNNYANHDILIVSGTGAGQRRRIASNTATAVTLSAAVAGNAETGNWTTIPDATSVYRIEPSHDFLYYQPGSTSANFYRLDISANPAAAWTTLAAVPAAPGSGGNTMYPAAMAPSTILCVRGANTSNVYQYNIGTNVWTSLTFFGLANAVSTGGAAAMASGLRRIILHQEGTVRLLAANMASAQIEPFGTMPYANPAGYDGKRLRVIKTEDGARFIYVLRAGGQEFFRVAVEWTG